MTTDPRDSEPEEDTGGDPVCWAQFVCAECGAMTTEGHREGCPASPELGTVPRIGDCLECWRRAHPRG